MYKNVLTKYRISAQCKKIKNIDFVSLIKDKIFNDFFEILK